MALLSKKMMGFLYGMGAAVVIVGALFKLQHWTGADIMLIVGLLTEAAIFALSAFEPVEHELDWSLVYPELAGGEAKAKDKKENPAEALSLIHGQGKLVDIELDDNYREWDDDLTAGAIHLVETLEFLYTVEKIGWKAPIKLDLFPYRENAMSAVKESIKTLQKLEACLDRIDMTALAKAQNAHVAMAIQSIVRDVLIA